MTHRHRQQYGGSQRGRGVGEVEVGKRVINGSERDLTLDGECTRQCADDFLLCLKPICFYEPMSYE